MSGKARRAGHADYEVYALRYATHAKRRSAANYLGDDPHDNAPMPLDFYLWVIRNEARTLLVDTGFSQDMAARRGRQYLASPVDLLRRIGIHADAVEDIVITHMHYDHAGNIGAFPRARLHLQEKEMAYCTGRCMCHAAMRGPFEGRDVANAVERLHAGKMVFHDGDEEIAPGLSLHLIGGHTAGLQVVRVATERGWLVLASDAAHYWDNLRARRPFPIVLDVGRMLDGHGRIEQLADGPEHIIPGHDPAVLSRFQAVAGASGIVALHRPPVGAVEYRAPVAEEPGQVQAVPVSNESWSEAR